MGFTKWVTKKGITGGKAREVGELYRVLQAKDPRMSALQISHLIMKHYTGESAPSDYPVSLGFLVECLVDQAQEATMIGRKTEEIKLMEREVVQEEMTKMGVPMSVIRGNL